MAIYELDADSIEPLSEARFADLGIKERTDLQRILRDRVGVVAENSMVLAEEFGQFEDSRRRIDLLALDRDGNLIVIELKRGEDGGHMDLQALRYAALVSAMTFEQAVGAHQAYRSDRGIEGDAEEAILDFLGWDEPNEDEFARDVRIVLVSAEFSKELTTAVMFLNVRDLDIRCVRLKPYAREDQVLVDVQQVLPLPEAADYQVKLREKARQERQKRRGGRDLTKFDVAIEGRTEQRLTKRLAIFRIVKHLCDRGASPEEITQAIPSRDKSLWRSAPGELTRDQFVDVVTEAADRGGPPFEPRRWYIDDSELIRRGGNTYAFTKMWGAQTEGAIEALRQTFSEAGFSVRRNDDAAWESLM